MRRLNDMPIRRKLTVSILLVSAIASLLACAVFASYDWFTYRKTMTRDLETLGGVLADNSTAALSFKDARTADELLGGLRVHPRIAAAALYAQDGDLFASYGRAGRAIAVPGAAQPDGAHFGRGYLVLFRPVELNGRRIGTIYLQSDLAALGARLRLYAVIVLMVLGSGLIVTLLLTALLQAPITRPILDLAGTARRIAEDRDYTLRVAKSGNDEVGQLTDSFNAMLAGIEARDSALRQANAALQAEIAERRKAELDLRVLNETLEQRVSERTAAAEKANRAKSEFLANMSHELRTPLNSVIGFANLLLKNRGANPHSEDTVFLERIRANGHHLLGLINQILDLSKVEAGRAEVHLAPLDLGPLLTNLADEFEGQLRGKDIRFHADIPEQVAPIDTDAEKLRQILINLIGNAIKFTERGSVTVRVRVDPKSRIPAHIDVVDTGIGIAPEKISVIFEAFRQADSTTSRRFGGTGLGLTISQALCGLLGYRLEVESAPGQGSTFRVVLGDGLRQPPICADAGLLPRERHAEPSRRRVLVIDDEAEARLLLTRLIEGFGYRVVSAATGEEGLRLARTAAPDAITLDLLMPGMDGWTVLRRLKDDPLSACIPVVVVSIVAAEHRGAVLGAVDVLQKPVSPTDLNRALAACNRPRVLVVEDNEEDRRLMAAILGKESVEARIVSGGREALASLAAFAPDVILLDLMMPEMDGLQFLDVLSRETAGRTPPVVIVTSTTPEESIRRYLLQWAQSIISKQDDLPRRLREALDSIFARKTAAGNGG